MLKLEDITYPITFHSKGVGYYTFQSEYNEYPVLNGDKPTVGKFTVHDFIDLHNSFNKSINDYNYSMPTGYSDGYVPLRTDNLLVNQSQSLYDVVHTKPMAAGKTVDASKCIAQFTATKGIAYNVFTGKIENMPVGAKLLAVQDDEGNYQDLTAPIARVEVDGDSFTFLSHSGSWSGRKFAVEISIKRGTMVKWQQH